MRSPAPSADRMASMTVSTAVAALARGIWARSTTRSTMSALIMTFLRGYPGLYNLLFLQSDGGRESGRRGPRQLAQVGQVGRRGPLRARTFGIQKGDGLLPHPDGLDHAFGGPAPERRRQGVVAGKGRQGTEVERLPHL